MNTKLSRTAWIGLVLLTAVVLVGLEFVNPSARQSPTLSATAETAMMLLALAAATLMAGTFIQVRRLSHLLAVAGLVTLAATQVVAHAVPAALHIHSPSEVAAGLALGELVAAGLFAASVTASLARVVINSRRPVALIVTASLVSTAVAELLGLALRNVLPDDAPGQAPSIEQLLERPGRVLAILFTVGLFGYAAARYARKAQRDGSRFPLLIAAGLILLASVCAYELALPWNSPDTVSVGTALRLLGFVSFFVAALLNDLELRSDLARAAAIAERSRVAQDLHDGLAQDLALIAVHAQRLAADLGEDHPLTVAARHALSLSRETIGELSETSASAREALQALAAELRPRFGIAIAVDVEDDAEEDLQPQAREVVSRIAREAIANAARHGRARNVVLSLQRTPDGMILRVCDDGRGFVGAASATSDGFGLTHMRDRAALLGGSLSVKAGRSGGTELELLFD